MEPGGIFCTKENMKTTFVSLLLQLETRHRLPCLLHTSRRGENKCESLDLMILLCFGCLSQFLKLLLLLRPHLSPPPEQDLHNLCSCSSCTCWSPWQCLLSWSQAGPSPQTPWKQQIALLGSTNTTIVSLSPLFLHEEEIGGHGPLWSVGVLLLLHFLGLAGRVGRVERFHLTILKCTSRRIQGDRPRYPTVSYRSQPACWI